METAKIGALLISLFFVVSIIASSFLYTPPPTAPGSDIPPDIGATPIALSAQNVPATVSFVLPKMRIAASTNETNISIIDSAIFELGGVKYVSGFYRMADETELGASLIYLADLQLLPDALPSEVIVSIEELSSIESVFGWNYAIVHVPNEVEFVQPDLNISRSYELINNETQSFVSLETIEGDEIELNINASFIGGDLLEIVAEETNNPALNPIYGEASLEAELSELEPSLVFELKADYSDLASLEQIEQQIHAIAGVLDINLSLPEITPKLTISQDSNISDATASDLNSFLQGLGGDVIFYNQVILNASIRFDQNTDIGPFKDSINAKLEELGLDEAEIFEQSGRAFGKASLKSADSSAVRESLSQLLTGFEIAIYQPGAVSIAELFDADSNTLYSIAEPVDSLFSKAHSVNETVALSFSYTIVRGKIDSISAIEQVE